MPETNPILQSLYARKSVRVFEEKAIPAGMKQAILEAAAQAPSAGCQQLYTILDITDPALKAALADSCDHQPFIAKAPLVLVFCADCRKWYDAYKEAGCTPRTPGVGDLMLAVTDTAIAAQNAVVAAESFGIGSCYIGDIMENCPAPSAGLCVPSGDAGVRLAHPAAEGPPEAPALRHGAYRARKRLPHHGRCRAARCLRLQGQHLRF